MKNQAPKDIFALLEESNSLNSKVFSLSRLKLMLVLSAFGEDGVQFRELQKPLHLSDGALISNLNYLTKSGYVSKKEVTVEKKNVDVFSITSDGQEMLRKVREWLKEWVLKGEENG